ncbi:lipid A deacylase LpxR family protein [Falsiroseomonas oryziterrae]|uniref:lipid A deacylase LpxR family protein n=1 Tax=Falsiroseomonas oryziterrae TaxID=2911368 RepID=UPI001F4281AB|nr:lipid A deacylase LpxR family protein [Roseomonas sp. NPKOSM-4]
MAGRVAMICGAALACLALPAAAQQVRLPNPAGTFAFILENDTFSGNDRYYTNGFLFAWRSRADETPDWLAEAASRMPLFFPAGGATRWGLGFGQKKWTPEDTDLRNPPLDDRPYAAWLYGSVTMVSYTDRAFGALELQFGVVGPAALGEQVQNNTHDFMNIDRALGWNTQIKDEPGLNLVANRQWRLNAPTRWDGVSVGLVPSVSASLGNVSTYGAIGVMARFGTELEADFGPPRVRPASAGSVFFEPTDRWGWYVFAGVEGRAVLRDISLDGNSFRSSRSVDRETWVGDAVLGAAVFFRRARLTATYTIRSQEFTTQRENAQFGSISLAFSF